MVNELLQVTEVIWELTICICETRMPSFEWASEGTSVTETPRTEDEPKAQKL